MIEIYFKNMKGKSFEKLEKVKEGAWINIENASKDDLLFLKKITNLSYSDLEDALDIHELPRIERKGGTVIFFVRDAQFFSKKEEVSTTPLTIIITNKYIITISISKSQLVKFILNNSFEFSTTQKSKFLINVLLNISKNFTKAVKTIHNNVEDQKDKSDRITNSDILKLIKNEELLNGYISALNPMKIVFETIETGKYIPMYSHDEDLIQDMIISMRQSVEICSTNLRSIRSLRQSYQIIFTNNLNKTIRLLTFFTIPTMIASFFGMNVILPLQNNSFGFIYILIMASIISLLFFVFFRIKKWF